MLSFLLNVAIIAAIVAVCIRVTRVQTAHPYILALSQLERENENMQALVDYQDTVTTEDLREMMRLREQLNEVVRERNDALRNIEMLVNHVEKVSSGA